MNNIEELVEYTIKCLNYADNMKYTLRDNSNEYVYDKIKNILNKLKITSLEYLGSGIFGSAFVTNDNIVVKFTVDDQEINIVSNLQGKKLENVAEYYKVYESKGLGIGILLMKKYRKLPIYIDDDNLYEKFKYTYNEGFETKSYIDNYLELYKGDPEEEQERQYLSDYTKLIISILPKLKETSYVKHKDMTRFFYSLLELFEAERLIQYIKNTEVDMFQFCIDATTALVSLKKVNVYWTDDHFGNFAVDEDGRFVAIDIGYSSGPEKSENVITLESIFRGK